MEWSTLSTSLTVLKCKLLKAILIVFIEDGGKESDQLLAFLSTRRVGLRMLPDNYICLKLLYQSEAYYQFGRDYPEAIWYRSKLPPAMVFIADGGILLCECYNPKYVEVEEISTKSKPTSFASCKAGPATIRAKRQTHRACSSGVKKSEKTRLASKCSDIPRWNKRAPQHTFMKQPTTGPTFNSLRLNAISVKQPQIMALAQPKTYTASKKADSKNKGNVVTKKISSRPAPTKATGQKHQPEGNTTQHRINAIEDLYHFWEKLESRERLRHNLEACILHFKDFLLSSAISKDFESKKEMLNPEKAKTWKQTIPNWRPIATVENHVSTMDAKLDKQSQQHNLSIDENLRVQHSSESITCFQNIRHEVEACENIRFLHSPARSEENDFGNQQEEAKQMEEETWEQQQKPPNVHTTDTMEDNVSIMDAELDESPQQSQITISDSSTDLGSSTCSDEISLLDSTTHMSIGSDSNVDSTASDEYAIMSEDSSSEGAIFSVVSAESIFCTVPSRNKSVDTVSLQKYIDKQYIAQGTQVELPTDEPAEMESKAYERLPGRAPASRWATAMKNCQVRGMDTTPNDHWANPKNQPTSAVLEMALGDNVRVGMGNNLFSENRYIERKFVQLDTRLDHEAPTSVIGKALTLKKAESGPEIVQRTQEHGGDDYTTAKLALKSDYEIAYNSEVAEKKDSNMKPTARKGLARLISFEEADNKKALRDKYRQAENESRSTDADAMLETADPVARPTPLPPQSHEICRAELPRILHRKSVFTMPHLTYVLQFCFQNGFDHSQFFLCNRFLFEIREYLRSKRFHSVSSIALKEFSLYTGPPKRLLSPFENDLTLKELGLDRAVIYVYESVNKEPTLAETVVGGMRKCVGFLTNVIGQGRKGNSEVVG